MKAQHLYSATGGKCSCSGALGHRQAKPYGHKTLTYDEQP